MRGGGAVTRRRLGSDLPADIGYPADHIVSLEPERADHYAAEPHVAIVALDERGAADDVHRMHHAGQRHRTEPVGNGVCIRDQPQLRQRRSMDPVERIGEQQLGEQHGNGAEYKCASEPQRKPCQRGRDRHESKRFDRQRCLGINLDGRWHERDEYERR